MQRTRREAGQRHVKAQKKGTGRVSADAEKIKRVLEKVVVISRCR